MRWIGVDSGRASRCSSVWWQSGGLRRQTSPGGALGGECGGFPGERMPNLDGMGVQVELCTGTGECFVGLVGPIRKVTEDGVAELGQMNAKLVCSSGLGAKFQQAAMIITPDASPSG